MERGERSVCLVVYEGPTGTLSDSFAPSLPVSRLFPVSLSVSTSLAHSHVTNTYLYLHGHASAAIDTP